MSNNPNLLAHRPTGVTLLGVLFVIGGAFALNNGLELNGSPLTPSQKSALVEGSRPVLIALGATLIPLGIASLAVAYGLFKAKRWAWSIAIVLSGILLAINVISLVTGNMSAIISNVVGIAINGIVLYYLSSKNVRQYFGKVTDKIASSTFGT
jgi:uncharacterized membrane protein (DUF2068 family)